MKQFLPVLIYQKIGHAPKNSHLKKEWTPPGQLQNMISWLLGCGYTFITPADLHQKRPVKPVLLAFIGGYQSFYTDAFPLLQKHKVCATLFLAEDTLGTYNSWQNPHQEPWQTVVTAKQLKEMHKSGLVQIGTLGLDGHNLLEDEPTTARQTLLESIYRFEKLYKISPCAVAFWPFPKTLSNRAQTIKKGINLPVIPLRPGKNTLNEDQFLRILRPNFFTKLLLWKNK